MEGCYRLLWTEICVSQILYGEALILNVVAPLGVNWFLGTGHAHSPLPKMESIAEQVPLTTVGIYHSLFSPNGPNTYKALSKSVSDLLFMIL